MEIVSNINIFNFLGLKSKWENIFFSSNGAHSRYVSLFLRTPTVGKFNWLCLLAVKGLCREINLVCCEMYAVGGLK